MGLNDSREAFNKNLNKAMFSDIQLFIPGYSLTMKIMHQAYGLVNIRHQILYSEKMKPGLPAVPVYSSAISPLPVSSA